MKRLLVCSIAAVLMLASGPVNGQYIYCSWTAGYCIYDPIGLPLPNFPDSLFIFVHAPDSAGVTGAHFRLETGLFGPGNVLSVVPSPGVVIESGDLFSGIFLFWGPVKLEHYRVLKINISGNTFNEPYRYCVREASLFWPGGAASPLWDFCTDYVHVDCMWPSLRFYHPDTANVDIGGRSKVIIRWVLASPSPFGCSVTVADEKAWVSDYTLRSVWDLGCTPCVWDVQSDTVFVEVPGGTPVNTLSKLTITAPCGDPSSLILKAVPAIGTRKTSWGVLKRLFH